MFQNRFLHLSLAELHARGGVACSGHFIPVAVPAGQFDRVHELYRLAAEQARAQLAPPRHLRPAVFSAN